MLNDRLLGLLTPPVRAYIRYFPIAAGKRSFWFRIVDPYFAWRSHRFVASTVFGAKIAGTTRDIIQQYIYYFGVWEPNLTRWIQRRLRSGDTFIDVGANIGYFSLLASRLVGESGTVVAIEASPRTFSALQGNLTRNDARTVRAVNVAVSEHSGMAKVFYGHECNIGLTTILETPDFECECEVESAPLSSILRPDEVQNARVIKIDVEGAEWAVVAGMELILNSGRPDLEVVVEVNPESIARQGKCPEDLLEVFTRAGFHPFAIENDYSPLGYLPPYVEKRPVRIRGPIESSTDVVFSRQDAAEL